MRVLAAACCSPRSSPARCRRRGRSASPGGDPSVEGTEVAWQQPGVGGFLRTATDGAAPRQRPAIGATFAAWHTGSALTVADRATLAPIVQDDVPRLQKLAVSRSWLAYRTPTEIHVRRSPSRARGRRSRRSASPARSASDAGVEPRRIPPRDRHRQLDPAVNILSGSACACATRARAALNLSLLAGQLLYVGASRCSQQLVLGPLRGGRDKVLDELGPLAVARPRRPGARRPRRR